MLRHLPRTDDPNLLVGDNPADDAALYRLRDDLALVQTVDFFTPVVDDPYTYGQIAAANSLSDVYAMGATPVTALNITAFPVKTLPLDVLTAILRGGADKAAEAGVPIVGGHTVDDDEPKYGLSVTGVVHPDKAVTTRGAKPGDVLVLTKPIGTGAVATALKAGAAAPAHVESAVRWMAELNRRASWLMVRHGANAATDITGYGLVGHLRDLCRASGVSAELRAGTVPLLPGAVDYVRAGFVPGGTRTNMDDVAGDTTWDPSLDDVDRSLLTDPQTSGGLLMCLSPEAAQSLVAEARGSLLAAVIGSVVPARDTAVVIRP